MRKQKKKYYTDEVNHQILISLLKQSGIKRVFASPGATNVSFVGSLQNDPFFEMYSCVDERSAAFMACGMAAETGEPVVLSCTGATSSRNYVSALTKAYYEKLPILAVTSTQDVRRIGNLFWQVTDRSVKPKDACVHAENIPTCVDATSRWDATLRINRALLALCHRGCGPVHINLTTTYSSNFNVRKLPKAKLIKRITYFDRFPEMPKGRIAIMVGSHPKWSEDLINCIDKFCTRYGAVVFGGHCANTRSKFCISSGLMALQENYPSKIFETDLLIHLGGITGDYANENKIGAHAKQVWRVDEDGALHDRFKKLTCIFEMSEEYFFNHYTEGCEQSSETNQYFELCKKEYDRLYSKIPELPFSNVWIAKEMKDRLPNKSVLHLSILNSLRAWDIFEIPKDIPTYVNAGGFGIDGVMSTCIGGAIAQPDKLHFLVIGDLAFFYDINALLNGSFPSNMRIMLINNGKGTEFRHYYHTANRNFGDEADRYIAAGGHFGNKSETLVNHLANNLGFSYITASNKEDCIDRMSKFFTGGGRNAIIFEVFTDNEDESKAYRLVTQLEQSKYYMLKKLAKSIARRIVPQTLRHSLKKRLKF